MRPLVDLRNAIDEINEQLLSLLSDRGEVIRAILELKIKQELPLRDQGREDDEIKRMLTLNVGPYDEQEIELIFRAIFEASKRLMWRKSTAFTERPGF